MRGTVFIPPITDGHRWFVISEEIDDEYLTVNITDAEHYDSTCVLLPGDHESVTKPSAVRYRSARAWRARELRLSLGKCFVFRTPCAEAVLERIIAGGLKSDELAGKFLKFLR